MKEAKNTTDRRTLRTRSRIRQSLIELLMEKEPSRITVRELSERADINRKTFYMYFSNIDDIVMDLNFSLADRLIDVFANFNFFEPPLDLFFLFRQLNDVISEDLELYRRLNELGLLTSITSHVKNAIIDILMEQGHLSQDENRPRYTLYAEYAAAGILSMFTKWFSMESDISLNELTETAGKLTVYGLQSVLHLQASDNQ